MSLIFYAFTCSKCGQVYELLGTPSPEDLSAPLCPSCVRTVNEHPNGCDQEVNVP